MFGVNRQLGLFFEQVGSSGYLKKSITVFQAAFFLIVTHCDVMRIFRYFIEMNKIYYYAAGWLYEIIFYSLYLFVTLVFYFLADVDFEERTARVRPETTQRTVNHNINISTAKDTTELSLLQENMEESKLNTFQLDS